MSNYIANWDHWNEVVIGPTIIDSSSILSTNRCANSSNVIIIMTDGSSKLFNESTGAITDAQSAHTTGLLSCLYNLDYNYTLVIEISTGKSHRYSHITGLVTNSTDISMTDGFDLNDLYGSFSIIKGFSTNTNAWKIAPLYYKMNGTTKSYGYIDAVFNTTNSILTLSTKYSPVITISGEKTLGLLVDNTTVDNAEFLTVFTEDTLDGGTRISRMITGYTS